MGVRHMLAGDVEESVEQVGPDPSVRGLQQIDQRRNRVRRPMTRQAPDRGDGDRPARIVEAGSQAREGIFGLDAREGTQHDNEDDEEWDNV